MGSRRSKKGARVQPGADSLREAVAPDPGPSHEAPEAQAPAGLATLEEHQKEARGPHLPAPARPTGGYVVAQGRAVATSRGHHLREGDTASPSMFDDEVTFDRLVESGTLVAR